jgi:hypothetical protein
VQGVVRTAIVVRAHRLERLEMRRNRAPCRKVSARRGDVRPAGPRQQRPEQKNRPAQPADKCAVGRMRAIDGVRMRRVVVPMPSTSAPMSRSRRAITSTSPIRGTLVSTHSSSVRRTGGQQWQCGVLVTFDGDPAFKPVAALDQQTRHRRTLPSLGLQEIQIVIATEADEHRLRPEADAKSIEHPALNPCGKSQHITCRRATTIDQSQRVFGRDPNLAIAVAALESACSISHAAGSFSSAGTCCKRRRLGAGSIGHAIAIDLANERIHEERPTLRVSGSLWSITMPLRRRTASTAFLTSATSGVDTPALER